MKNETQNESPSDVPNDQLTPLARAFLWVESPAKVKLAIWVLAGLCAVLFLLDFIVHRHAYAPNEGTPGFYALTGFLAFSFIVLGSGALRWFIARPENYYSPNSIDTEDYPEAGLERLHHSELNGPHRIGDNNKDDKRNIKGESKSKSGNSNSNSNKKRKNKRKGKKKRKGNHNRKPNA